MARVKFTRQYDHTWPSGAVTSYPNNYEGTVREEVAEAAVKIDAARRVAEKSTADTPPIGPRGGKLDRAEPEPTLPGNLPAALAEPQALKPNLHVAGEGKNK